MTTLYIANPKPQQEVFAYRIPDYGSPVGGGSQLSPTRTHHIPAGGQISLPGDLSTGQVDAIIDQHLQFGLVRADDVSRKQLAIVPLICSVDRPVSTSLLTSVLESNQRFMAERGRRMRREAAIATSNRIHDDMMEGDMPGDLTNLEMEVVEQRTSRSTADETAPQRVRVNRNAPQDGPARPPRVRQGRKRA